MRHLIVKALHREESFLAEGVERLSTALKNSGVHVNIRDLYRLDFQPVLSMKDFNTLNQNQLSPDILLEQDYIRISDILWVVFPVWWSSMPAILKGYIDRVFLSGFAYNMKGNKPVGLLAHKKVIILNSMGMSEKEYSESGMFDALRLTIDKGIFEFSGMQVLEHRYFTSIMSAGESTRNKYLDEITELASRFSLSEQEDMREPVKKAS